MLVASHIDMYISPCRVKELKGERDRKSAMERNPSGSGIVQDQANTTTNTQWPDPSHYEESFDDDDDDDDDDGDDDDLNYSNDDYFSNESDILDDDTFNVDGEDLFDVDFPHEQDEDLIQPNFNDQKLHSPPPLYNGGMVSAQSQTQMYGRSSSYHQQQRPNSMSPPFADRTATASGLSRPLSLQMKRSSTLPRSLSMYSPSTRSSLDDTNYSAPQRITVDTSLAYQSQPQQQQQQTPTSSISSMPSFSFDKMDEFVKFHRAEIREITDCTKKETKLVANISLDLSSNFEDQQQQNNQKSQSQFVKYLRDLDEVLDRKLAAVEALRDRINDTVSQVEL